MQFLIVVLRETQFQKFGEIEFFFESYINFNFNTFYFN